MSVKQRADLDFEYNARAVGLPLPINGDEAANKDYVDGAVASPGGVAGSIQFNNGAGEFGGSAFLTWNVNTLQVIGQIVASGNIGAGNLSGTNTGDQDISGIAVNAGNIATNTSNISANTSAISTLQTSKQDTLVSGTNIKTVNGNSLLGSGDITISTSVAWGSITGALSAQTDLWSALGGKQDVITTSDVITEGTTNLFLTVAERNKLSNLSGTNTGDVSLAGTLDYLTQAGQVITVNPIDLSTDTSGVLGIASGGTGQSTANAGLNALLPTQTANGGRFLQTDGTNTSWAVGGSTRSIQALGSTTVISSITTDLMYPVNPSSANFTVTLPSAAGAGNNIITFHNYSSVLPTGLAGEVTIQAQAGEIIINPFSMNNVASFKIKMPGEVFRLYRLSSNTWGCIADNSLTIFPNFQVNRTAVLTGTTTYDTINFTVKNATTPEFEAWDVGNYFNLTNDRYVPLVEGEYEVMLRAAFNSGLAADLNFYLVKNTFEPDASVLAQQFAPTTTWTGSFQTTIALKGGNSRAVYFNGTTDYITAQKGSFGNIRDIPGQFGNRFLSFSGRLVRRSS
jgi:hypothetical protein